MNEIYYPEEDSYLLSKVLEKKIPKLLSKNQDLTFLEIGSGSGIQLKTALKSGIKKQNIFSCDINQVAVEHCKGLNFNCVYSDLFENIKSKYDLIIFNPPYLPEDSQEPKDSKISTTGGEKGSEIINKFLKQAKNHLNENGKIFLLISSLTKEINYLDYDKNILAKKKLFYEELSVWELNFVAIRK
jgi:release factor glutamine methyltransferase|tara:strand:+ start:76 stop:633 length:558 start_codon:yes stop_codon:yes gene_type:complete